MVFIYNSIGKIIINININKNFIDKIIRFDSKIFALKSIYYLFGEMIANAEWI
jgi:hypothetical protein